MTIVSTAKAATAGTLDTMTATATATSAAPTDRARSLARTGGPEEGSSWLEHVLGWTLVVVVAMFVTQVGWL
ncbi:SCO1431 family membrane protein [Streptomyces xanthophaeus]|uniref:SCO1431 family membrane protein n=1 Tax=Streptomyces xanthophaeus TaxID=67385 RepID=UPI003444D04B